MKFNVQNIQYLVDDDDLLSFIVTVAVETTAK